jgi:putative ABC transport system permease protein
VPAATRMLVREWRGGELGVLVAALVLAVGVVVGISLFTSRLQGALEQESHRFLAADRVVASARELPGRWWRRAGEMGLARARTLSFPSMVYAGEEGMSLASVKAVSDSYPLRGGLRYRAAPFGAVLPARAGPARGEVWLDSRLFSLLDVQVGGTVSIGEAQFSVAAAAGSEPDPPGGFFAYGPRVLMHYDDIPATGIVQPGSRVQYRQLYAGEPARLAAFTTWLKPQLQADQRLIDVRQGQPAIGSALRRAERFLLLAGSLAVVLAGVAIALAALRFSQRHGNYVAILKSLGATGAVIDRLYGGGLLLLGLLASAAGCLLGWGLQALFFRLFAEQLPVVPGPAGVRPYLIGGATALTCLLCFAWPPLWRLGRTSPLRVLRRELPLEGRRTLADYLLGLAAVALLMFWYSGDWKLALALLAGLAMAVLLGLGLALALLRLGRAAGTRAGSVWRLALAGLQRRGSASALQVVVFALAIMLMLVLLLVRTSLIDAWQTQLPADAPNHFMVNIAPEEVAAVDQMLRGESIVSEALYPMIRGRIMAVNGEALPEGGGGEEGPRQRESNFTWSRTLPEGNSLVAGRWWPADSAEALVSVERGFAERMGIALGDRLDFLVGSQPLTATVASLRELQWQSMRPNFFLIFPPKLLAGYPATFMTSFHLDEAEKPFLNRFIRRFPTVTVIEMDVVVGQIQAIVATVSAAVELVLAVILAAGALVLVAGVRASGDERMLESAILRALGARRGLILGSLLIEFATLGLCAGLLATIAAECSVWLLQERVMEMTYAPSPRVWPLGPLAGLLLIGGLGVFSCRRVVSSPPVALLREL